MNYKRHLAIALILVALSTVVAYFLLKVGYQLPLQASSEASQIDQLIDAHFILIAFLFSLVAVLTLYGLVVFRRREGDDGDGDHIHGNTTLEILWTVLPLILVAGFGTWGVLLLNDITEAQPNEMRVKVEGQRWSWNFSYPDLGVNAPVNFRALTRIEEDLYDSNNVDLILPVDQPIVLEMEAKDVLHSFWVPEFRVKQDLVPGKTTYLRFTPTVEGRYQLQCAEICGGTHAYMLSAVYVVSQACFNEAIVEQVPFEQASSCQQYLNE